MVFKRVIPNLLILDGKIVKTQSFQNPIYIGDPCNTARIFNELEVDELMLLDIDKSISRSNINFGLIEDIASECLMPLTYGGGIKSLEDAKIIFSLGVEKILINSAAITNPNLITSLADTFGSQALVVSIDYKKNWTGNRNIFSHSGKKKYKMDPLEWAMKVEKLGAGEVLLTSITNEGTWSGFDTDFATSVANSISIPLIVNGGGGSIEDVRNILGKASIPAVSLGSLLVFQKRGMGVLVNFPKELKEIANFSYWRENLEV